MDSAIHRLSRDRIYPRDAVPGKGRYVCSCCEAPVHLVRGPTAHFAHEKYRARHDCDNYVWSEYRYSGRPTRPVQPVELERDELSYLAFEMSTDGPRLALYLPPVPSGTDSKGSLQFSARLTRTIPLQGLTKGLRLSFPLHDGQWTLRAINDASEDYVARLVLGHQSLEFDRNLFSASSSTGRRIEPQEAVVLGESLWWIGRADIRTPNVLLANVVIEQYALEQGWYIHHLTLPTSAAADEFAAISTWLERHLQPKRARVWVESPWARQLLPNGTLVYSVTDGPLVLCADQPVSLQIDDRLGKTILEETGITRSILATLPLGDLVVKADGVRVGRLQIIAKAPQSASSAIVHLEKAEPIQLVALQAEIENAICNRARSLRARLRWQPASMRAELKYRCTRLSSTAVECEFTLEPGDYIKLGKLGKVEWPTYEVERAPARAPALLPHEGLFRWLASVGSPWSHAPRLYLRPSAAQLERFPMLRRVACLSWPVELSAQVQVAARALKGMP